MAENKIQPAAEFQALPLEFIIATPLVGAIKAQAMAAEATKNYVKSMLNEDGTPITVDFKYASKTTTGDDAATTQVDIKAPLLAIVPVPHLRIDSITTQFKYEISQVVREDKKLDLGAELSVNSGPAIAAFASATLKGSVSSSSSSESTTNRSGSLEISVHASEAPIPEGLARILSLLASSIPTKP